MDLFPITAIHDPNGKITIAGLDLSDLAREWGTPLYLYDAATILRQVSQLRQALASGYRGASQLTYAAKAYFSLGMARRLAALGLGVDVVSLGEMTIARRAGFNPQVVHVHGNNKSPAELEAALRWGVQAVVVDSLDELALLEELACQAHRKTNIWLRVTPGLSVDTHPYRQTAHPASKFGLPIEDGQAADGIRRAKSSDWLDLVGLHTHLGSQFFEIEPYRRAVRMLCDLAEAQDYIPRELSPGGGFGVRYTEQDPVISVDEWVKAVGETVEGEYGRRGWPLPKLVLEPGRMIVAQAGVAIYTVGAIKTAMDGTRMVAVDGGMADNPRPALYQSGYAARLIPKENRPAPFPGNEQKVTIVGKFCETGDQLIPEVVLPEARRGDLLVIPVAGAYQLSMASNYNLAPRPASLWVEEGRVEVLQPREELGEATWWVG